MLKHQVEAFAALRRLRAAKKGVVSFEYVIVAAIIATTVAAAFNGDATVSIKETLANAISTIVTAVAAALGA